MKCAMVPEILLTSAVSNYIHTTFNDGHYFMSSVFSNCGDLIAKNPTMILLTIGGYRINLINQSIDW
jgi:hypothetical protein